VGFNSGSFGYLSEMATNPSSGLPPRNAPNGTPALGPFQGTNPADHGILCAMGSVAATPRTLHHSAGSSRRGYTDIKARDETAMRWLMNAYQ
jgi:hypothetical protein